MATIASHPALAQSNQSVYVDSLQNGWQNWSWAGSNLSNTSPLQSGTASVRVEAGPWAGFFLHHDAFNTTPYKSVRFWIHGGTTGGQQIRVQALLNGAAQSKMVDLAPLAAGQWRQVEIPLADLGVDNKTNMDGFWLQNVSANAVTYFVDNIELVSATTTTPPPPAPPATPTGLTAEGRWEDKAVVAVKWNAVSNATSYKLYRNNSLYKSGLTGVEYKDTVVTSSQTYTYRLAAVGSAGESAQSDSASATAPSAPPPPVVGGTFSAPTNLRVQGLWQNGSTDIIAWSPVPNAASYRVYQYDTLIGQVTNGTTFTVPKDIYYPGMTYAVTAVDANGVESLPSNIVTSQGGENPSVRPSWMPGAPTVPRNLVATPEWNGGKPRVRVAWQGTANSGYWIDNETWNVYRDGKLVAAGIWGLSYIDNDVAPGERHSYTATGVTVPWTAPQESAQSPAVTATALSSGPSATVTAKVNITKIVPNDDSVIVYFDAVPGAADYRAIVQGKPGTYKYSGGGLSVEVNAVDVVKGADVTIEAVDKLGPFQKMDGFFGPGAMNHDGSTRFDINGQGDPSNIPNVIARSGLVHVTPSPYRLTGSQVFFDNFRGSQPFVQAATIDAAIARANFNDPATAANRYVKEWQNDKWILRNYNGDMLNSRNFVMSDHFMDTVYDGGTPGGGQPMHNNVASLLMQPKATADLSGGKVLHVTFEVDPHFSDRRWCDVFVAEAGDPVVNPGLFAEGNILPTVKGNMFRWEIKRDVHKAQLFTGAGGFRNTALLPTNWAENEKAARIRWDGVPLFNGTPADIDRRHRYDLYLSQNRFRLVEEGTVIVDKTLPNGATLPFSKASVYFVHQVYHSHLDRPGNIVNSPADAFWTNHRPWADERHWDNMGFEVLSSFPQ